MKKKFFNKLSLTLCLVSCAAIVFWPNSAGAAISGATSSPSLLAGTTVLRPDGVAVKLPKKWEEMTIDDLSAIGIYPNMKGSNLKSSAILILDGHVILGSAYLVNHVNKLLAETVILESE